MKRWLPWYAVLALGVAWALSLARELHWIARASLSFEHTLLFALTLPLPFVLGAALLFRERGGEGAPSAAD